MRTRATEFRIPRMEPSPSRWESPALIALTVGVLGVLAVLTNLAFVRHGDSSARGKGVAIRAETIPADPADDLLGHGTLKVMNESSRPIALRLIAPEFRDSRTLFVPAWEDRRVLRMAPGIWTVRYCMDGDRADCAELDQSIGYSDLVTDETLHYVAAVIRFGPSQRELPPGRRITREEFAAD